MMSTQNGTGVHVGTYVLCRWIISIQQENCALVFGKVVGYFRPHSTRAFMEYQGRRYRDVCRSLALADDPVKGVWQ